MLHNNQDKSTKEAAHLWGLHQVPSIPGPSIIFVDNDSN